MRWFLQCSWAQPPFGHLEVGTRPSCSFSIPQSDKKRKGIVLDSAFHGMYNEKRRWTTMLDEKDLQMIQEMLDRSVEQTVGRTESRLVAYIESAVMPKFDLLADGHKLLLDTMAPKSRVEELEDEVSFMKQVIKAMSRDIAELKKAQ